MTLFALLTVLLGCLPYLANMDQALTICTVIACLVTIAFLYNKVTKEIPTRLIAEKAPKSRFELTPASTYDAPVRTGGIEYVDYPAFKK